MGGAPAPGPMDGASDVPPGPDAGIGGDPGMGGEPPMDGGGIASTADSPDMGAPIGGDMPADGNGQLDPNMGMDDGMGGEPPMDGGEGEEGDDSTMSIINQLSPEDREAVRSYAESMLARDESGGSEGPDAGMGGDPMGGDPGMGGGEPPMGPDQGGQPPMMETVIFKKGQLKRINEALNIIEPEEKTDDKGLEKRKGKTVNKKSPFNSPKFK